MKKKILLLSLALGLIRLTVVAQSEVSANPPSPTGRISNDTLYIEGTGPMTDYIYYQSVPWFNNRNAITTVKIADGVTNIGHYSFYQCSNLTSVSIPEGVTSIGVSAFYECSRLTEITIPNSVTRIIHHAFQQCSGLTAITIPYGVTSIESSAFDNCRSLTEVAIPGSVTSIESYAFNWCLSLTSVTIPAGVTSIGNNAFYNCTNLTEVTNLNPVPQPLLNEVFHYVDLSKATLYVPIESVEAYRTADIWKNFGTIEGRVFLNIEAPTANAVRIRFNPANNELQIQSAQPVEYATIYDLTGKQLHKSKLPDSQSVNVSHLPAGVYILKAGNYTGKFVKN